MSSSKVALVTGSGKRRLGWHIADALAERGYGIVLNFRTAAQEAAEGVEQFRKKGVDALAVQADLADETAVKRLVQTAVDRFGRLDVLVNGASIWESMLLERVTAADLRRHFDANVLATFLCAQHAGLVMVGQPEGGCIINFGDWAEARPYVNFAAYFACKGAIPALTRCLAVELGTRNPRVRVNCILPGPVLFQPDSPGEEREKSIQATLTKRAGTPHNIAQAVLGLIENDFATGVCIPIDGGRTIYAGG